MSRKSRLRPVCRRAGMRDLALDRWPWRVLGCSCPGRLLPGRPLESLFLEPEHRPRPGRRRTGLLQPREGRDGSPRRERGRIGFGGWHFRERRLPRSLRAWPRRCRPTSRRWDSSRSRCGTPPAGWLAQCPKGGARTSQAMSVETPGRSALGRRGDVSGFGRQGPTIPCHPKHSRYGRRGGTARLVRISGRSASRTFPLRPIPGHLPGLCPGVSR